MRIAKSTLSLLTAALLAGASTLALAQTCNPNIPLSKPDSRYSYNSSGNEVTDNVTSLIWKRCVEGMSWNGTTCSGSASAFNWEQALAHAATQTGWRMPNQKELQSLVETACDEMAINAKAFPATPSSAWSGSPLRPTAPTSRGSSTSTTGSTTGTISTTPAAFALFAVSNWFFGVFGGCSRGWTWRLRWSTLSPSDQWGQTRLKKTTASA